MSFIKKLISLAVVVSFIGFPAVALAKHKEGHCPPGLNICSTPPIVGSAGDVIVDVEINIDIDNTVIVKLPKGMIPFSHKDWRPWDLFGTGEVISVNLGVEPGVLAGKKSKAGNALVFHVLNIRPSGVCRHLQTFDKNGTPTTLSSTCVNNPLLWSNGDDDEDDS